MRNAPARDKKPPRRTSLYLGVVLCGLIALASTAVPRTAQAKVTGLFGLWWGAEEIEATSPVPPGVGLRVGVRPHERVAVMMEGFVSPNIFGAVPWNLLWGVRLNPVLRTDWRLDLDLKAGLGYRDSWTLGRFYADDSFRREFAMIRVEGTLLGSLSRRVGLGPRLRIETQPVAVRDVTYRNGKTDRSEVRLASHGHTVLASVVLEADAPRYIGHLAWNIGGGVLISGDAEQAAPLAHFGFTWTVDLRDHRDDQGSL